MVTQPIEHLELLSDNPSLTFKVKHFIKSAHQKNWQQGDRVFISRQASSVIGYARLVPLDNNRFWLRGLFVAPQRRRQGVAAQLTRALQEQLFADTDPTAIFCFPLAHLADFYLRLGYRFCTPSELPPQLAERFYKAQAEGKNWLLMGYFPTTNRAPAQSTS